MERKCPKCKRVIPKDALLCPYCGKKLTKEKIQKESVEENKNQEKHTQK